MREVVLNEKKPLSEQSPKKMVLVEMFRAGPQISSTGQKMMFTEEDLDDIVNSYDFNHHEAPLIQGHDQQEDTPALGWVREIWRKGKSLWGKVQLTPKAEQLIRDGVFKKVSSSFYLPNSEQNPTPGKLSLRHLGLVPIPAVKGLLAFSEITEDTITITPDAGEFSISFKEKLENTVTMARKKAPSAETPSTSVDHGEMTVNIHIGGGDGKSSPNVYDDSGFKTEQSGSPAPEYAAEEEPLMEEEGDEMPPSDEGGAEDLDAEAPEGEEEGQEDIGEEPDSEAPGAETEDISEEVDGADERIAQLASEYDISELIKALALAAESSDMTEEVNYGELPEALAKKIEEKRAESKEHEDEETKEEEKTEHSEKEPMKEDEEEEDDEKKVDHACGDNYSEEQSEPEATRALDHSESAVGDRGTIDLQTRVAELEAELAHQKRLMREKEISDFVEGIYESGKLVDGVVNKSDLVRFMGTLNAKNSVNFSEQGKATQFDFFKGVLDNLPAMVSFEEVATPSSAPARKNSHRTPSVDGFVCDPQQAELHERALSYAEEKGVDFATAIKAVFTEAESI